MRSPLCHRVRSYSIDRVRDEQVLSVGRVSRETKYVAALLDQDGKVSCAVAGRRDEMNVTAAGQLITPRERPSRDGVKVDERG